MLEPLYPKFASPKGLQHKFFLVNTFEFLKLIFFVEYLMELLRKKLKLFFQLSKSTMINETMR